MAYNNDIFKIITELDKRNFGFYKKLNEKQYKELQPYILLRWFSSTNGNDSISKQNLLNANELNKIMFGLGDNKDLLLDLLCNCGSGKWCKHSWIPIPKAEKASKDDEILKKFFNCNESEYKDKKENLTKEEVKEIMQYLGYADLKKA